MIRLSLIIATYNRSWQLLVTLGSVAAQSAPADEWECVVVDNNSADDTSQAVRDFAAAHPDLNIRCVVERRQGLSYARNCGIAHSGGEYIAIIDDDERIVPDFVSAYIELFDTHPEAASAGGVIVAEYETGRPRWISRYTERPIANPMNFGDRVREFPRGHIPGGGNMAVRRSAICRYGGFDVSLGRCGTTLAGGEESDFFERLASAGERCFYTPRAVMYHIIPPRKLTREYFVALSYNTGLSQRRRAELHHRLGRLYVSEIIKWIATLLLCLVHRPSQSRYLIIMRYHISRAIFS
ncbi:MAG: glycosyltransferase [Alistipes sp.]|nr:glycosyltransferase [Alistipes sp.]